jgi:hypothetical protein
MRAERLGAALGVPRTESLSELEVELFLRQIFNHFFKEGF